MYEEYENELYHAGVKGMKWGVRRYQNADGSLTPAGKKRYGNDPVGRAKLNVKAARKDYSKSFDKAYYYSTTPRFTKKGKVERDRRWDDTYNKLDKLDKAKSEYKQAKKAANESKRINKEEFRSARKDVSASRSTGAKLATNVLAGPFANRTYNSVIASGGSKNEARAMTAVAALVGGGSPFGHLAVSAFYTHDAANKK